MEQPIVYVDVDDVCLDLVHRWVAWYNDDWDDDLQYDEITDWDLSLFVKPECGKKIYNYLDLPNLYDNVQPVPGAITGVETLRTLGARVVFATSVPPNSSCRLIHRYECLLRHGFLAPRMETDIVGLMDKSLLRGAALIDDHYGNIKKFKGIVILMTRPWNRKYNTLARADTWGDVFSRLGYLFSVEGRIGAPGQC